MTTVINGIYFLDNKIEAVIREVGGVHLDQKERPVVALIPSLEEPEIFWAIPMGDLAHRTPEQIARIHRYLEAGSQAIGSCFYHIGKTDKESLFFMSDIIPVTDEYISREYRKFNRHLVIKNKRLIVELNRKAARILAYEKAKIKTTGKYFFRQNIFGIYERLKDDMERKRACFPKALHN